MVKDCDGGSRGNYAGESDGCLRTEMGNRGDLIVVHGRPRVAGGSSDRMIGVRSMHD